MKIITTLSFFIFITFYLHAQSPDHRNSQVMILGSYHMHNPGADMVNVEADDVLVPKRQQELQQLVNQIAAFKPTMIALEHTRLTAMDTMTQENYQKYLKDSFELTRWEGHQIGFRMAKQLGHETIFNIDEKGVLPFGDMMTYAQENDQNGWVEYTMKKMEEKNNKETEELEKETIGELLYDINIPENLAENHALYVDGARIGRGKDFPGAELLIAWYRRNALIFSNIYKITEGRKNERILVIFGAGHAHILRELVRYSTDFELVEPNDYLEIKD